MHRLQHTPNATPFSRSLRHNERKLSLTFLIPRNKKKDEDERKSPQAEKD
jgi:hypothetical protein